VSGPTRKCVSWSGRWLGQSRLGAKLAGSFLGEVDRRADLAGEQSTKMEARQRIGAVGGEIAGETLYTIRIAAVQGRVARLVEIG
jgi:hypothetical protein